ncbi:Tryptophan synthase alpha chain [hydrothermal vent metagenome]|uniref:tryptophan synthase n=1 Tax=hydrothermal vent metagenome TaxID=652676 RepID=A0A3B1CT45_9ZZZZ
MSRITKAFEALQKERRKALVLFITAGDPSIETTIKMVKEAHTAGADIIELGIPFSDPLADGAVIQESFYRAIAKGVNIGKTLEAVKKIRKSGCQAPIVFMLSSTLVINHGVKKFMNDCALASVDGVILPDVPIEEADEFMPLARKAGLDTIMLAAPTSTSKRLKQLARLSSGFLYYISVTGVTGEKRAAPKEVGNALKKIKTLSKTPVCAGFGITDGEQARQISRHADGVVIGTQAIRVITKAKTRQKAVEDLVKFVRSIRRGLDGK